jgi:hypothetical protein
MVMKLSNLTYLGLFIITVLTIGCADKAKEKNALDNVVPKENTSNKINQVQKKDKKKGIAYAKKTVDLSRRTDELNAAWMYSWGSLPNDKIPKEIEFVPMFWGGNSVNDNNISRLKELKNKGDVNYILAFNEPDSKKQANMTVDEVIALWPRLEEIGLPLSSPGAVHPDKEWMIEFMHKADSLKLRVDFVTVHHYGGANAEGFLNKLQRVHEMYNKPIWITEFAVADWDAKTADENKHSEDDVLDFMKIVLPKLEELSYIEKYAWFDGRRAPYITSSLYDENLKLTKVGEFYSKF